MFTSPSHKNAQNHTEATVAVREAGDTEIDPFEESTRSLRLRNTLVPINQLPPGILMEIFMSIAALPVFVGCRWNMVAEVCAHWRKIATACAPLWTTIDFNHRGWEIYSSRTDTAPLTFNVRGPSRGVFDLFSRTLVGNLHRVRECRLTSVSAHFETFFDLLESTPLPIPILETLELTSEETDEDEMPIFDKHVPSLRQLRLKNVKISWTSPCLSGLTHLSISLEDEHQKFDVLRMLQSTTALESLELSESIPRCPAAICHHHCAPSPLVRLANLSQLRLRDGKLSTCAHFVTHLEFPESAQINLVSRDFPNIYRLAQIIDSITPNSSNNCYKLIVDLTHGVKFTIQSLEEPLHHLRYLSLYGIYELARITQSLHPVFGKFAQITYLDLSFGDESPKSRHWWKDLGGMDYISDLCIRKLQKAVSLRELLYALGMSKQLQDTSFQILLPGLRRLHLIGLCTRGEAEVAFQPSIGPHSLSELLASVLQMRRSRGFGIQELKIKACDLGSRGDLSSMEKLVDDLDYDEETCDHCRRIAELSGSDYEDTGTLSDDEVNSWDDTDSSSDETDSSSSDADSNSSDTDSS